MFDGVRVIMNVRVVSDDGAIGFTPFQEYDCVVQPLPAFYHRRNVLLIQAEALAKMKYINSVYAALPSSPDLCLRLPPNAWAIEARNIECFILSEVEEAA